MKFKIFLAALAILLLNFLSIQAQTPCECADKKELMNLLNLNQMAIQELNYQLGIITATEVAEKKPVMYSDNAINALEDSIINALATVRQKGLDDGSLTMFPHDCSMKETGKGNFCVQQIKKIRYSVHQKICQASLSQRDPQKESYLNNRKMAGIIQEYLAAYKSEQALILQLIDSLPKDCRPNNWFGYVSYQKVSTMVSNETLPPDMATLRPRVGITIRTGGNKIVGTSDTYNGTIIVEEGKMLSANASAELSVKSGMTVSGRISCNKNKPDENQVDTGEQNDILTGNSDGKADFSLNVSPREYSISMLFFSIPGSGQKSGSFNSSGGCGNVKPTNNSSTFNTNISAPNRYSVKGNIRPESPNYLEGYTADEPKFGNSSSTQGNISVTRTYKIIVRWMLRRLPPR